MAAIYIKWNGKYILECKKSIIEAIREEMDLFILLNKIQLNEDLGEVMLALDRAGSGFGFDLADYLHTKNDILMFIDLTRKGIDKYNQECPGSPQSTRDTMEGYYQELVKIGKNFPE